MWVIGDIHGCLDELEELLDLIPDKDPLLFIGDYIDRGPASAGVVDRVLEEKSRSVFLKGNHEDMMIAYYRDPESREGLAWTFYGNGGPATLRSYGLTEDDPYDSYPKSHRQFYENLQLYYEDEDCIAVHAGVRVGRGKSPSPPIHKQDPEDLIWIREEWIRNEHRWDGKRVFYGHTPSRYVLGSAGENDPIVGEKSVGLDTGCVFGGSLSAMNTKNDELIQVKARRDYL
ncbi:MAG: metallophosphoesterase family protein [Leptospirales bacterium]|jgi:serine/threonine protein phosphatase 1